MKLIIDIPKNYDLSKIQNGSIASKIILNAVKEGIPLDDIKAEIEDLEPEYDFEGFYKCQSEVLNIIDRHTSGKMLVCPNCGLDVHSDFENCPRCGERMKNE